MIHERGNRSLNFRLKAGADGSRRRAPFSGGKSQSRWLREPPRTADSIHSFKRNTDGVAVAPNNPTGSSVAAIQRQKQNETRWQHPA